MAKGDLQGALDGFGSIDTGAIEEKYKQLYGDLYDVQKTYQKELEEAQIANFGALQKLEEIKKNKNLIYEKSLAIEREKNVKKIADLESSIIEDREKARAAWEAATDIEYATKKKQLEDEKHHEEVLQKVREKNTNTIIAIKEKYAKKIANANEEDAKKLEEKEKQALDNANKKIEAEAALVEAQENGHKLLSTLSDKNTTLVDKYNSIKNSIKKTTDAEGNTHYDISALTSALADFTKSLDNQIEEIASYKSSVDTRLQGTSSKYSIGSGLAAFLTGTYSSSYWDQISQQITGAAGISPYVKQSDIAKQVQTLVAEGINTNVAQRAFLQTIKDKVASTFDATNGTLLRLIRIQQQDSTAARLGMESTITQFLNNMYENTEYLNSVSTSVKSSLEEAMSLMTSENAISFEYQVQKWLGSYYSVGVSDSAVTSIASSLGKIASGDISGITEGGVGNLVVMAANQAGLSIADILTTSLDDSETNQLMQAMSGYLYDIMQSSSDNLVVQQQIANVYGMTAADLKAIANLYTDNGKTISNIAKSSSTYSESMSRLNEMISTIYKRESVSEMMTNAFSNLQYTISAGIANSPVLYATYKIAGLLEDVAGGIEIPMISVMGNTVDLHTSVAQLLQVATLSGSLLSGIGQMIASGGGGGLTTSGLARAFGISEGSKMTSVSRGGGIGGSMQTVTKGSSVSDSGYVGNENGGDVKEKTMTDASNDSEDQLVTAQEEDDEKTNTDLYNNTSEIISLINAVIEGSKSMHVKVDDYGLTGWN